MVMDSTAACSLVAIARPVAPRMVSMERKKGDPNS